MQAKSPRVEGSPAASSSGRIEIRVQHVDDLFQSFDPAPMEERRIAVEADAYISERAAELSDAHPFRLLIQLPAGESHCSDAVQRAFRTHFATAAKIRKSMIRQHFRASWRTFFMAVLAAIMLVTLSQAIAAASEAALMNKFANGLSIAVWVVLWRPFEMLIHDWRPMDREYRLYRRLEGIEVESMVDSEPTG